MLPSSTFSEPSLPPRNAIPTSRENWKEWPFAMGRLHNYVFGAKLCVWIKQITNLWSRVGRRVSPLPVWDVNDFFWCLPDTNFRRRTTVEGTYALSRVGPLSPKPMDSKKMDVTHLTSNVPVTDNRLGQKQSGHFCWSRSKPVTTLNLSWLATSEAATPRTGTVITERSFLLKMVWCSKPIDLWFQPHWEQSI